MSSASCSLKYADASTLRLAPRGKLSFGIAPTGFGGRFTTSTVNVCWAVPPGWPSEAVTVTMALPSVVPAVYVTVLPLTLTGTTEVLDDLTL